MPFKGFEGPAGTGKTHELIGAVRTRMAMRELQPHQRVLSLTFMHGSRRRLLERFAEHAETKRKSTSVTVDSFAAHVLHRWRASVQGIPAAKQFDEVCDACGALLEQSHVARWVAATYPIVAIDEAQELKPCRLRIVKALAEHSEMFVAADEFQCLDEGIDTAPFMEWFHSGDVQPLTVVRRTNRPGLLSAGIALRQNNAPVAGQGITIRHENPNQAPFAIGHVLNAARGTPTAILVAPGGASQWAADMIPRWNAGLHTARQNIPPVLVAWESGTSEQAVAIADQVCNPGNTSCIELCSRLRNLQNPPAWIRTALNAIDNARRVHGRNEWVKEAAIALFERKATAHRAFGHTSARGVPVMSIHGAKNRQFRNVIVLWGHGVPGTAERQRRLLYNAITRAEQQCTVFVRAQALLNAPPFT